MRKCRFIIFISLLSCVAGFINLYALQLFATSASHMTGAFTKLVSEISRGQMTNSLFYLFTIASFFIGSTMSGLFFSRKSFTSHLDYGILFIGLGILLSILPLVTEKTLVILAFLTGFMGIQNGIVLTYNGMLIRTSHFTGYLTDVGVSLGQWLAGEQPTAWKLKICSLGILSFCLGGGVSAILFSYAPNYIVPIAGMLYCLIGSYYLLFLYE